MINDARNQLLSTAAYQLTPSDLSGKELHGVRASADDQHIYVATRSHGFWSSNDVGKTFSAKKYPFISNNFINDVYTHANDNKVYLAVQGELEIGTPNGILGGIQFKKVKTLGMEMPDVNAIFVSDYQQETYVGTLKGLFLYALMVATAISILAASII